MRKRCCPVSSIPYSVKVNRGTMDKPIGVMDSGVGGLTVAKEIMRQLPDEQIIYFGDLRRCPYGDSPIEEVRQYTIEVADHLDSSREKMIYGAGNTAPGAPVVDT